MYLFLMAHIYDLQMKQDDKSHSTSVLCFFLQYIKTFKKSVSDDVRENPAHTSTKVASFVMKCHDSNMPVLLHGHRCPFRKPATRCIHRLRAPHE